MLTDNIKSEIKKVIVGKDEIIEKVLTEILAQGHTGHNAFRCDRLFGFRKIKFRLCV